MKPYRVIGLMSGTSLDGLDIAYCTFTNSENNWNYRIEQTQCIEYDQKFKQQLKESIELPEQELKKLDLEFGKWIGTQLKKFVESNKLEVDLIASHGHTVHHRPDQGITVQIGDGAQIAMQTGIKTICDFRTLDVSLGGQGAPLVPIGDQLLFSEYEFCLNLGGISNISFEDQQGVRKAFDVSIANMLLNYLSQKIGLEYDSQGHFARSGSLDIRLLNRLNELDFYSQDGPKSIGYEWFVQEVKPLFDASPLSIEDQLHTASIHIAYQLVKIIKEYHRVERSKLLITGGGAYNDYLIEMIEKGLGTCVEVVLPNKELISYKEALIFGFMGLLKELNQNNCLSSVTGALRDCCAGKVFCPK